MRWRPLIFAGRFLGTAVVERVGGPTAPELERYCRETGDDGLVV